jgi:uncharacterized protein
MDLQQIRKIAVDNMATRRSHLEREPGYVYHHGLRTANLAIELMARIGAPPDDDPVLFAGALFHDVGKGFSAHHETGADIANSLLADVCSSVELDRICDIVRYHCIRKQGLDLDNGILAVQDADMIDHFGTQEIWINFHFRAYNHENQGDAIEFWDSDNFRKQTARLRELLNFDISKSIYDDRVDFQDRFLSRLKLESAGRLPDEI